MTHDCFPWMIVNRKWHACFVPLKTNDVLAQRKPFFKNPTILTILLDMSVAQKVIFFFVWVDPIWRPFWRAFEPFAIQNRHQVKSPKDGWSIMSLGSSLDEQYICLMKSRTKSLKRPLSSVVIQACDVLNNLNKLSCWIPWLMCVSSSRPTTKQNKQTKHHDSCFKQKRLVMYKHGCHETWTTKQALDTVVGSEIRLYNHLVFFSNPVKNGINYQTQLVPPGMINRKPLRKIPDILPKLPTSTDEFTRFLPTINSTPLVFLGTTSLTAGRYLSIFGLLR